MQTIHELSVTKGEKRFRGSPSNTSDLAILDRVIDVMRKIKSHLERRGREPQEKVNER